VANPRQRRLTGLAAAANRAYGRVERRMRTNLRDAYRGGKALHEARKIVGHGGWAKWLADNLRGYARTDRSWREIFRNWQSSGPHAADTMTVTEALRPFAQPRDRADTDTSWGPGDHEAGRAGRSPSPGSGTSRPPGRC
jgi:hypothetical protein